MLRLPALGACSRRRRRDGCRGGGAGGAAARRQSGRQEQKGERAAAGHGCRECRRTRHAASPCPVAKRRSASSPPVRDCSSDPSGPCVAACARSEASVSPATTSSARRGVAAAARALAPRLRRETLLALHTRWRHPEKRAMVCLYWAHATPRHSRPPSPTTSCCAASTSSSSTRAVSRPTLVAHIGEVERRRLYARDASPSMFAYCRERLHLLEAEAYMRIRVARAARKHPLLLDMLRDGRLHLSAIREALAGADPREPRRAPRAGDLLFEAPDPGNRRRAQPPAGRPSPDAQAASAAKRSFSPLSTFGSE